MSDSVADKILEAMPEEIRSDGVLRTLRAIADEVDATLTDVDSALENLAPRMAEEYVMMLILRETLEIQMRLMSSLVANSPIGAVFTLGKLVGQVQRGLVTVQQDYLEIRRQMGKRLSDMGKRRIAFLKVEEIREAKKCTITRARAEAAEELDLSVQQVTRHHVNETRLRASTGEEIDLRSDIRLALLEEIEKQLSANESEIMKEPTTN